MRRKSTALASLGEIQSDSFEVNNTGLRPSWDVFWEVEAEEAEERNSKGVISPTNTASTSTNKSDSGIRVVKFITGSEWIGEWDKLGMCGMGIYKMPHGVIYEGTMNSGVFEGVGVLRYPNGGALEGFWHSGKLKYCQYDYADGLKRDTTVGWPYCTMPDRRFVTESVLGLRAADTEMMTDEDYPRDIPPGQYDAGDGFYNPRTKCVTDPYTGEVLRIPTKIEENWTLNNCRMAEIETIGFRRDLYENWYKKKLDSLWEENYSEEDKNMLLLIHQEGLELESQLESQRRSVSIQCKLDNLFNNTSLSSIWSRSTGDFEGLLKKIMKDIEDNKQKYPAQSLFEGKSHSEFTIDEEGSDEISVIKLLHEIAISRSAKLDKQTAEPKKNGSEPRKKEEAAQHLKIGSRMISVSSDVSISTTPFLYNSSYGDFQTKPAQPQGVCKSEICFDHKDLSNAPSDLLGSKIHYEVDYEDYEESIDSSRDTE